MGVDEELFLVFWIIFRREWIFLSLAIGNTGSWMSLDTRSQRQLTGLVTHLNLFSQSNDIRFLLHLRGSGSRGWHMLRI